MEVINYREVVLRISQNIFILKMNFIHYFIHNILYILCNN